jgi:cupin 2 domain-containing protein
MAIDNLFEILQLPTSDERFDVLAESEHVRIERIVSTGQSTPAGTWYDQGRDEWVALIQGEAILAYDDGREVRMKAGDHILISAHERHRVESTSANPPCIWIAVHLGRE